MRFSLNIKPALFGTIFLFLSIISYGCGSNQTDNEEGVTGGDTVNPDVTGGSSDGGSGSSGSDSGDTGGTGIEPLDVSNLPGGSHFPTYDGSSGGSGESGSSTGGVIISPKSGPLTTSGPYAKADLSTISLWRGAYFKFDNDSGCQHHQINTLSQIPTNTTDEEGNTTLTLSTNMQNVSDSTASEKYKYKAYYTKVTYNPDYIRFYEGHAEANVNAYDEATITIKASDLEETLNGFHGNKVSAFLNGFYAQFERGKNHELTEIRATITGVSQNSDGDVSLEIKADMNYLEEEISDFTFYYTLFFYDSDFVTKVDLPTGEDETFLEEKDCKDFVCETSYTVDFEENTIFNAGFTALVSWGFLDTSFTLELKKIGAYASLEQNNTGGKVTYKGEVYHPDCGFGSADEAVTPMTKTESKTYVCKNEDVCRAEEASLGWITVNPSDSTSIDNQTINLDEVSPKTEL